MAKKKAKKVIKEIVVDFAEKTEDVEFSSDETLREILKPLEEISEIKELGLDLCKQFEFCKVQDASLRAQTALNRKFEELKECLVKL